MDYGRLTEDQRNKISLLEEVVQNYKKSAGISSENINKIKEFFRCLVSLCKEKDKKSALLALKSLNCLNLALPIKENFKVQKFGKKSFCFGKDLPGFPIAPVLFKKFHDKLSSMTTKAAPTKILVTGTDDKERFFLCKYDKHSDMRKESRMITIFDYINRLLSNHPDSKRLKLRLSIYSILYIGNDCGIVE